MIEKTKEIRRAVETGKVLFGTKQAEKCLLESEARIIIMSSNTPKAQKETMEYYAELAGVPVIEFEGTAMELGAVCGKPFTISVLLVKDAGKSKIMQAVGTEKKSEKTAGKKKRRKRDKK